MGTLAQLYLHVCLYFTSSVQRIISLETCRQNYTFPILVILTSPYAVEGSWTLYCLIFCELQSFSFWHYTVSAIQSNSFKLSASQWISSFCMMLNCLATSQRKPFSFLIHKVSTLSIQHHNLRISAHYRWFN